MTSTNAGPQSKQVIVDLAMSEAEARSVQWQGSGPLGPIGQLLDSKQINERDLAWAVRNHYNPRVKEAARTILAGWIGKSDPVDSAQRYGPEVVVGSRYLQEQELDNFAQLFFYAGFAFGAGLIILVTIILPAVLFLIQSVVSGHPNIVLAIILIATLPLYGIVAWELYRRIRNNLLAVRSFRAGREGEESVLEKLRATLDNRWTIFRSLQLPGHKADCDLVLVGPGGVWLLEVKAYRGTLRVQGRRWERQTKRGWTGLDANPTAQVSWMAQRVHDYLQRQGINRWIETAVVLAEPQPVSNLEASEIPVWLLPQLEEQVASLSTRTPPTDKEIKQIAQIFTDVATKQLAKEEAENKK